MTSYAMSQNPSLGGVVTAEFKLYVTDEAGTVTNGMDHYNRIIPDYARRPEIQPLVEAETGISDIEQAISEGLAVRTSGDKNYKCTPQFKRLLKVSGAANKIGLERGDLKLPVTDDVPETLEKLTNAGAKVRVYSSGGKDELMLGWQRTTAGDLSQYVEEYHSSSDPATKDKKSPESYKAIAQLAGISPQEMCFVTDDVAEAEAALGAGVGKVYLINRDAKADDLGDKYGYVIIDNYAAVADETLHEDNTQTGAEPTAEASE